MKWEILLELSPSLTYWIGVPATKNWYTPTFVHFTKRETREETAIHLRCCIQWGEKLGSRVSDTEWANRVVHSINMKESVLDAFKAIWDTEVTGLAVLNDNGQLVGNISASDLKVLLYVECMWASIW